MIRSFLVRGSRSRGATTRALQTAAMLALGVLASTSGCATQGPRADADIPPNHVEPDGGRAVTPADHLAAAKQHHDIARAARDLAELFASAARECSRRLQHRRHSHRMPTTCSRERRAEYSDAAGRGAREEGLALTHERLAAELAKSMR